MYIIKRLLKDSSLQYCLNYISIPFWSGWCCSAPSFLLWRKKYQQLLLWNDLVSALSVCWETDWSGLMCGASAISAWRYALLNYLSFYGHFLICSAKVLWTTLRWWILIIHITLFISVCTLMHSEGNSLQECTVQLFIPCIFLVFLAEVHSFLEFNESLSKDRLSNGCSRSVGCGHVSGFSVACWIYLPAYFPSTSSAIAVCDAVLWGSKLKGDISLESLGKVCSTNLSWCLLELSLCMT